MARGDECEYAVRTESGTYYCSTGHPDECPYPARFCKVRDRRDAAAALLKPTDTIYELLLRGF